MITNVTTRVRDSNTRVRKYMCFHKMVLKLGIQYILGCYAMEDYSEWVLGIGDEDYDFVDSFLNFEFEDFGPVFELRPELRILLFMEEKRANPNGKIHYFGETVTDKKVRCEFIMDLYHHQDLFPA